MRKGVLGSISIFIFVFIIFVFVSARTLVMLRCLPCFDSPPLCADRYVHAGTLSESS